jgi:hypothetical protein
MAGIEDLIEVFRGESIKLNPFRKRTSALMNTYGQGRAGKYATTLAEEAANYATKKFPNRILKTKITPLELEVGKKVFHQLEPDYTDEGVKTKRLRKNIRKFTRDNLSKNYNILSKKNKAKLKIDILKTIASNAKALTPLALKGLSIAASLPAQVIVMTLAPTEANADEVNMQLEDFAKLAEEAQPKEEKKEKEMMAAGGNVPSTDIKDYYRRSWGIGDRVGFNDGSPRKIYKVIRVVTDVDRIQNPNIPKKAKYKIQLPGSAIRGSDSTTQMVYGETKGELNTALKDAEKIKYVKPKLPKNNPNHPLYEPPEVKKDKFLVKKYSERVKENISKVIYEEVIGSKNQPKTYNKTGNTVTKYKPFIGKEKITIEGKGANTLAEAQTFVDDYFKNNPKKVIVADPNAPKKSKDLKKQKIIAAKGAPLWLTGDPDVHKGHGTNVANPDVTIKPSNIFATPEKINVAMAPKDAKIPKNIYTDLDFKIDAEETKMKDIKKSDLPESAKKTQLQAIDNKLVDLAIASDGYKTVTLSDGSTFNLGTQSMKSYDMMEVFPPDWSEQKVKKFVSNYLTEEGKLKSQWHVDKDGFLKNDPSTKLSNIDRANIEKSYVFLENVKNAKANAKKILPKVEKEFKKFGLTLNSDQVNKAKTFLRSAMNKGQNIFKFIPNKVVRKGGGAAVAVLDYALFHHLFGVPQTEALIAAGGWLTKNDVLGKQIIATAGTAGIMEEDQPKNLSELVGLPGPYKEDDEVGTERLTEMAEVMKVPERKASGGLSGVDQYIINRGI